MTFLAYQRQLKSWIKSLPPSMIPDLLNIAREDIYNERQWSFLYVEDYIRIPVQINVGTCTVTKYSTHVTNLSASLKSAISALTPSDVNIIGRQFRISDNQIYTIVEYNITDINNPYIVLDRPYLESTTNSVTPRIYKCYFSPSEFENTSPTFTNLDGDTILDFQSFYSIVDTDYRRQLRTDYSRDEIDKIDPTRSRYDIPRVLVSYKYDSNGFPLFESYPAEIREKNLKVIYIKKGKDFSSPTDKLPFIISKELLMVRARYRAYEWAMSNQGEIKELNKVGWMSLMQWLMSNQNSQSYPSMLDKAKSKDEEIFMNSFINEYNNLPYFDISFGDTLTLDSFVPSVLGVANAF